MEPSSTISSATCDHKEEEKEKTSRANLFLLLNFEKETPGTKDKINSGPPKPLPRNKNLTHFLGLLLLTDFVSNALHI